MPVFRPDETFDRLTPADTTNFWRLARHEGVECLSARFRTHEFPPHSHETFVIGAVTYGTHAYHIKGEKVRATAGQLCFINPGDVHDTAIEQDGYSYRMTYPSIGFLQGLLEREDSRSDGSLHFCGSIVDDAALARLFFTAHVLLESDDNVLAADEAFLSVYNLMIQRYAGAVAKAAGAEPVAVERAKELLAENLEQPLELALVADAVGLSPFHFIRVFRKATGLNPSAWVANRRIQLACRLLRQGESATRVGVACGFFDQSHFTRAFKSRLGVTPGEFRRASAA